MTRSAGESEPRKRVSWRKKSDADKKLLMLGIAEIYEQIAKCDENLAKERRHGSK
jgi:hypothetical protein